MQQNGELSVEEILESIKRVIARDNREGAAVERHRRESEGVILRGPGASFGVTPPASTVNDDELEDDDADLDDADLDDADLDEDEILELGEAATELDPEEDDAVASVASHNAQPVESGDESEAAVEPEMSADIDLTAAQSASPDELAAASAQIAGAASAALSDPAADGAIPEGETPIERMVRESLRPMLREWLDANLPPIVERIVKSELERIMGRSA